MNYHNAIPSMQKEVWSILFMAFNKLFLSWPFKKQPSNFRSFVIILKRFEFFNQNRNCIYTKNIYLSSQLSDGIIKIQY